ncbi:hypothetical protein C9F11_33075 [Streptomyces sp. YIM 121038]|uniref:DUF4394 domain-containing protein n=1 Tax=Streptomyces sp. YIM 121038 TaxID=2136401 RepID=UPI001110DE0E|nr:DUF4394 domain-containing protein [Streptomyces sp. YIM 121038]QCX80200.1 hypothetical protein C9F11_33075 [Streptomyces sp. YIM 121038]
MKIRSRTHGRRRFAAAVALLTASTALVMGAPGTGSAAPAATPSLQAFGISGDGLLMAAFKTDNPRQLDWVREITGLKGDQKVVGIDFRVQDGQLYGVGDKGGIYTFKWPPEVPEPTATKVSQLQFDLLGTNFGVDFNPAADRLRVISDGAQNLRHNLNTHTTDEDVALTTPPITGWTRGVSAAAYTNNDLNGATGTLLFDVDTKLDQLVVQAPANNGTLSSVGSLGVDAGPNAGLDIYSTLSGGKTVSNAGFAILGPASGTGNPSLYNVNLFTGATDVIGRFPVNITDIAIYPSK